MKRIVMFMLCSVTVAWGSVLAKEVKSKEPLNIPLSMYFVPDQLMTGKEKLESKGGRLEIPPLAIVNVEYIEKNGRRGKAITFDVLETIKMNADAPASGKIFSLAKQMVGNGATGQPAVEYVMQLDKRYLPGKLFDPMEHRWGPLYHNVTDKGDHWMFKIKTYIKRQEPARQVASSDQSASLISRKPVHSST